MANISAFLLSSFNGVNVCSHSWFTLQDVAQILTLARCLTAGFTTISFCFRTFVLQPFGRLHHGKCSVLCAKSTDNPSSLSTQSCYVVPSSESQVTLSKHSPFVQLISLINTVPALRVICIFMSLSHPGVISQTQPK